MRWSIIRLIWLRELKDQLRDRRTVFMIAVLPILLYPVAGFGFMELALGFLSQKGVVGLAGAENLLPWSATPPRPTPAGAAAYLALTPPPPGVPLGGIARLAVALSLSRGQPCPECLPPAVAWLAVTPPAPGDLGLGRLGGAAGLAPPPPPPGGRGRGPPGGPPGVVSAGPPAGLPAAAGRGGPPARLSLPLQQRQRARRHAAPPPAATARQR